MRQINFNSFILINILFNSLTFISGQYLSKFKKEIIYNDSNNISKRYLEDSNPNDSFMVIYFKENCNYKEFYNIYRRNVSYIINKGNNIQLTSRDELNINKEYGIEIHFNNRVKNLEFFFSRDIDENMQYLISVDLTNFDSSSVTIMDQMFYACNSLESIILSNSDISKVESMGLMFYGCSSLESINLSNLKAYKLDRMSEMFSECNSLKSVDFSNFDCPLIFSMSFIFFGCSSLEYIDFTNFHTPQLFDMYNMFYGCTSLKSINLSSFDTSQVSIMNNMFYGCSSLRTIDLSNFDMKTCTSYDDIFSSIDNIKYINLYNFKNDKIISQIFNEAKNIFFVCQKDKIIINPNAYNCCDFNFETEECNSYQKYSEEIIIDNTVQEDSDLPNLGINNSKNDSNIGIIIGIIAGVVVLITVIITVIFIYKKYNTSHKKDDKVNTTDTSEKSKPSVTNTFDSKPSEFDSSIIYEFEPEIKNNNKISIIIQTTGQITVQICISPDKKMCELINYYFEIIGRKNLINDPNIRFLVNGDFVEHNSEKIINDYIYKYTEILQIVVDDVENKIIL